MAVVRLQKPLAGASPRHLRLDHFGPGDANLSRTSRAVVSAMSLIAEKSLTPRL
jgi:hypothetical protein